jgi:hypothetical protein
LYPYLKYLPSLAAEPRNEHKKLYGIIKHLDDPFWDEWLPPSDWNCKCRVKPVRSNENAKAVPKIKKPPAALRTNPGKTAKIFTDNHPMIKRVSKTAQQKIEKEFSYLFRKYMETIIFRKANKTVTMSNKKVLISKTGLKKIISQKNYYEIVRNFAIEYIEYLLSKAKFVKKEVPLNPVRRQNIKHVLYFEYGNFKFILWELKPNNDPRYILHGFVIKKQPE